MRNRIIQGFICLISGLIGCSDGSPQVHTQLQLKLGLSSGPHEDIGISATQGSETIEGQEQENGSWLLNVEANTPTVIRGSRHRALDSNQSPSASQASQWVLFEGQSSEIIAQPGEVAQVDLTLSQVPSRTFTFRAEFEPVSLESGDFLPVWTGALPLELYDTEIESNLDTHFAGSGPITVPQERTFQLRYTPPLSPNVQEMLLESGTPEDESPTVVVLSMGEAPPLPPTLNQSYILTDYNPELPILSEQALADMGYNTDFPLLCHLTDNPTCLPESDTGTACTELLSPLSPNRLPVQIRYQDIADYPCGFATISTSDASDEQISLQVWTSLPKNHPYLIIHDSGQVLQPDSNGDPLVDPAGLPTSPNFKVYVGSATPFIPTGMVFDGLPELGAGFHCPLDNEQPQYSALHGLYVATHSCELSPDSLPANFPVEDRLKIMVEGTDLSGIRTFSSFGIIRMLGQFLGDSSTRNLPVLTTVVATTMPSMYQNKLNLDLQIALNSTNDVGCTLTGFSARLPDQELELGTNLPAGSQLTDNYIYRELAGTSTAWLPLELTLPDDLDLSETTFPITLDLELDSNCDASSGETVKDTVSLPLHLTDDRPRWVTSTTDTGTLHLPAMPWHDPELINWIPSPYFLPVTGLTTNRNAYTFEGSAAPQSRPAGEVTSQREKSYYNFLPESGAWTISAARNDTEEAQTVDYKAHQVTQPLLLTNDTLIVGLLNPEDHPSTPFGDSGVQRITHSVSNPQKLLHDPVTGAVIIVGDTPSLTLIERVSNSDNDTHILFDQDVKIINAPCGANRILDATVSLNYRSLTSAPAVPQSPEHASQLSMIVETSGAYSHCTITDYLTPDLRNYYSTALTEEASGAANFCTPGNETSGSVSTGDIAEPSAALGYFPNIDTFVIATSECVGSYQVHSPNTGTAEFSRLQYQYYSGYGPARQIETDPFSGHFFVKYEQQTGVSISTDASGNSITVPHYSFGTFEILPADNGLHARTNSSYRRYDGVAWDYKNGHPYLTGHTDATPQNNHQQAWVSPILNDKEFYGESTSSSVVEGAPTWHQLSINAGARLLFAIEHTVGNDTPEVVAFPIDSLTSSPQASWPILLSGESPKLIDMIQMGPQVIGGLPAKLQPGGIYTLKVMGHAPNASAVCIQGACVAGQPIAPTALRFHVPIDWKHLDSEIPAHITVLSKGIMSSPLADDVKIGQSPIPWSMDTQEEFSFSCDQCITPYLIPDGDSFGLLSEIENQEVSITSSISYERATALTSEGPQATFDLTYQGRFYTTTSRDYRQSRDRETTLVKSAGDITHLNLRTYPAVPSSYGESSIHYQISDYFYGDNGVEETYLNYPFEMYPGISTSAVAADLDSAQLVAAALLDDGLHTITLHTTNGEFRLSSSNAIQHTAPMASRPWLSPLTHSSTLGEWSSTTEMPTDGDYDIKVLSLSDTNSALVLARTDSPHIWLTTMAGLVQAQVDTSYIKGSNCLDVADSTIVHLGSVNLANGSVAIFYAVQDDNHTLQVGMVVVHNALSSSGELSLTCKASPTAPTPSQTDLTSLGPGSFAYSESEGTLALIIPSSSSSYLMLSKLTPSAGTLITDQLVRAELAHTPTSVMFSSDGLSVYTLGRKPNVQETQYSLIKTLIRRSPRQ